MATVEKRGRFSGQPLAACQCGNLKGRLGTSLDVDWLIGSGVLRTCIIVDGQGCCWDSCVENSKQLCLKTFF